MADVMRGRRTRLVAGGLTVAVVLGASLVARAMAAGDPTSGDRTSTATLGSVAQRLDLTGTVQQVDLRTARFAVQGTVSSVAVSLGQKVKAGQALARLDPADLQDAVTQARATLARAQESLAADESGTSTSAGSGASGASGTSASSALPAAFLAAGSAPGGTRSTGSPTGRGTGPTTGAAPTSTASARQQVLSAQTSVRSAEQAATAAQRLAEQALARATTTCAPALGSNGSPSPRLGSVGEAKLAFAYPQATFATGGAGPTPSGSPTGSPSPTTPIPTGSPTSTSTPTTSTPTSTGTGTGTGTGGSASTPSAAQLAACIQALTAVRNAQAALTTAQAAVTAAQSGLDAAQRAWQKALTSVSTTTGTSGSRPAATGSRPAATGSQSATSPRSTTGSTSARSSSTGSAAAAAARIASDQASITQAELALGKAEANLADATLTAPISGVVAAVGLTPGAATGGSISLIGSGGATVTVEVPATSIARVVAGEQVDVTPPGGLVPVAGTVQQVSLLPAQSSTTSSVTTYPVVIAVAQPTPTLAAGSRASASILLDTAEGVVTVPNSAITTTSATTGVVTLVSGSTTTRTSVTLGVIGATRTQIVKGVKAGQQVLLADPTQPLPTSSATTTRFGGGGLGGGGGFGGAGGFGGGTGRRAVSGAGG